MINLDYLGLSFIHDGYSEDRSYDAFLEIIGLLKLKTIFTADPISNSGKVFLMKNAMNLVDIKTK